MGGGSRVSLGEAPGREPAPVRLRGQRAPAPGRGHPRPAAAPGRRRRPGLGGLWNGKSDAAASTETTLYNLAQNGQIELCGFPDGEVGKDRTAGAVKQLFDSGPDGKIAM